MAAAFIWAQVKCWLRMCIRVTRTFGTTSQIEKSGSNRDNGKTKATSTPRTAIVSHSVWLGLDITKLKLADESGHSTLQNLDMSDI